MKIVKKTQGVRVNKRCRFCRFPKLSVLFKFGNVPLAGGFLQPTKSDVVEKYYPLSIVICRNCLLLQVPEVINPKILFSNYLYSSSAILSYKKHFSKLSHTIKKFKPKKLLEIGSNDGTFLENFKNSDIFSLGVDPSENLSRLASGKGLNIVNDFFSEELSTKILKEYGKFDFVVSINSFAHVDKIRSVMVGIDNLLSAEGVLLIEIGYAGEMISGGIFDTIYHEHVNYYTLFSLQNFFKLFEFEVFKAEEINMFGGSIRVFVKRIGNKNMLIDESFRDLYERENERGLHKISAYKTFSQKLKDKKHEFTKVVG